MKRLGGGLAALALLCVPAVAQEQVTAKSGAETRAGWIGSVGANCTANAAPEVKPTRVAAHGQIKLVKATVQTNKVAECPGIKIPAVVVFYTSQPGFTGTDSFELSSGSGPARTYTITVQ